MQSGAKRKDGGAALNIISDGDLRKMIKAGELSGAYLLFGDEDYLKAHASAQIREAVLTDESFAVFNEIAIDSQDFSPSALADALAAPAMSFGIDDKKLITVKGLSFESMKASVVDELVKALSLLEEYDHNVVLITVPSGQIDAGRLPKKPSALLKKLGAVMTLVHFEEQTPARLASWAVRHFEHLGVRADAGLCSVLINKSGRSMYVLSQEIEKLAYYIKYTGRDALTERDIETVAIAALDCDTFDLTNAIIQGDRATALSVLEVLKFRRVEPLIILSEISSTLTLMSRILCHLEVTSNVKEIASATSTHEYRVGVIIKAMSTDLPASRERVRSAMRLCSYIDEKMKTSGVGGYEFVERLVCGG